jgi:hypothetical protein
MQHIGPAQSLPRSTSERQHFRPVSVFKQELIHTRGTISRSIVLPDTSLACYDLLEIKFM